MKILSDSEYKILQIFWENGGKIDRHRIYRYVEKKYPGKWPVTSISVFLTRMKDKGILTKEDLGDEVYWISISKAEYFKKQLNALVSKQENTTYDKILLGFVEDENKRKEALEKIEKIISELEDDE